MPTVAFVRAIIAKASYNISPVVLLTVGLVLVPHASEGAFAAIGVDPSAGHLVLSVLLGSLVVLTHNRLHPQIAPLFVAKRHAIEPGEREVSVLFVDIRGYMTFSEDRPAADVFSIVNRYAERVSHIVHRYGGSVVEFSGDGIMAVFGAPNVLLKKERGAVRAGLAIIKAVGSITIHEADAESVPLSVGVGIATGPAFVGDVRAGDHMIWTVIGNPANLAARLQSLTRDLHAAIITDAATYRASREAASGFEHHPNVPIRGRRRAEDVYVLPLAAGAILPSPWQQIVKVTHLHGREERS